jgi:adenosylmethionine-8-amino-7-oxononanoate aminotransferase
MKKEELRDLIAFDRDHLWHPYTSATTPLPAYGVKSGRGAELELLDGRKLIDGMSSWWCAIHGYNHPRLNAAAKAQIDKISHVMFGGLTHEPAVELGKKLLRMAPSGLEHIFYSDSGSVAVEVALKMALQYQQAKGEHGRTRIMTLQGGYHGDTFGAMSVCDPVNGMHHLFNDALPKQIFAPRPACAFDSTTLDAPFERSSIKEFSLTMEMNHHRIAAVILEPIVQGAGGMYFYHPEYLREVRALCDKWGILLILDEIATGFGRTGKLWGANWSDITPDIMCVGKALTGGFMSFAATLATPEVAHGISKNGGVFMHGPTFMGNPLAAAIASESLEIIETGDWKEQVKNIESWLKEELLPLKEVEAVEDVRVLGAIGVVEMKEDVNVAALQESFVADGAWIRPFGKLIYLMPPYIINRQETRILTSAIKNAISNTI